MDLPKFPTSFLPKRFLVKRSADISVRQQIRRNSDHRALQDRNVLTPVAAFSPAPCYKKDWQGEQGQKNSRILCIKLIYIEPIFRIMQWHWAEVRRYGVPIVVNLLFIVFGFR